MIPKKPKREILEQVRPPPPPKSEHNANSGFVGCQFDPIEINTEGAYLYQRKSK